MGFPRGPAPGFFKADTTASKPPRDLLRPKLLTTLKGYKLSDFTADLGAGVVVGIVALPLAIAFAIASGVSPEKGLITAVVAGFLISVLGGSRVQIGGPTGAFVVIVYGIVERHGTAGLAVATFMAGALLIAMGIARLGGIMRFIPHPVIVGFTSGIAVIIASSQIRDFFGLGIDALPSEFFAKWAVYLRRLETLNPQAMGLGMFCLGILLFWPRLSGPAFLRKIPASLVALVLCTVIAHWFRLPVETIGSRFGAIPNTLPAPHLPVIAWATMRERVQPAIAIAPAIRPLPSKRNGYAPVR
jgi:SulP family sulfate permease